MTGKYGTVDQDVVGGFDPNSLAKWEIPDPVSGLSKWKPPQGAITGATVIPDEGASRDAWKNASDAYMEAMRSGKNVREAEQAFRDAGGTDEDIERLQKQFNQGVNEENTNI